MKRESTVLFGLSAVFILMMGCATIPGKSGSEQVVTIDQLVEKTIIDLQTQSPQAEGEILQSVGVVVMSNTITKIPIVGVGSGFGVAINNKTGQKTYLRMRRFDIGAGWGARSVRPVLIFQDEKKFLQFTDGNFEAKLGMEAAAKVGDSGAAGGAGGPDPKSNTRGYTSYLITDTGVSATASLGFVRVKPIKLKK